MKPLLYEIYIFVKRACVNSYQCADTETAFIITALLYILIFYGVTMKYGVCNLF